MARNCSVDLLQDWVLTLVANAYKIIDWDARFTEVEDYNDKLLRDVVTQVACTAGDELCLRSGQYDFTAWYFGTEAVNPDVLASTICEGAKQAATNSYNPTAIPFHALWARFLTEQDPTVRKAYLYGFGCLTDYEAVGL